MAKCNYCNNEMTEKDFCSVEYYNTKAGQQLNRIRYGYGKETQYISSKTHPNCHDCNVKWGNHHHPGCDMEDCPICGNQLISCEHGELLECA